MANPMIHLFSRAVNRCRTRVPRSYFAWMLAAVGCALPADSLAIPLYARSTAASCIDCHSLPPKLNARGEAFLARGYRRATESGREAAFPVSLWVTGRREERSANNLQDVFLPKVELLSGGPIGKLPLSYFAEWRVVSLELQNNGTLRDRSGRFEDVILNWEFNDRHALRMGQFRALNQYDVSLRLSVSEPAVFSTALPGDVAGGNSRITGLRGFAPSGRSPGFAYTFKSIAGPSASDGLFHTATLPFVGELSAPLSSKARREASFELEGPVKGVFLETFYRRGLNSIGAHAFLDNGRRIVTGVARFRRGDFHGTAALGMDDASGRSSRTRSSLELEYISERFERVRAGAGFRMEQITRAGRDPAYIPYVVLSGPNTTHTFVLQIESRFQGSTRTLLIDLSSLF
ncbi:MAG: hypothetical protein ACREH8_07675 [Opitutaceae bacterium]